jgi:hypothetical protein
MAEMRARRALQMPPESLEPLSRDELAVLRRRDVLGGVALARVFATLDVAPALEPRRLARALAAIGPAELEKLANGASPREYLDVDDDDYPMASLALAIIAADGG